MSPLDFEKAVNLWEKLKLPVRLRTFKSGVMVVQSRDRTDETTIKSLKAWLADLQAVPPEQEVAWGLDGLRSRHHGPGCCGTIWLEHRGRRGGVRNGGAERRPMPRGRN